MYIAHKSDTGETQSILEHGEGTAKRCHNFGVEPFKSLLYLTGLVHDVGKYQPAFQLRINGEKVIAPHAFCGAQEIKKRYGATAPSMLMQYVIAGHHAGLPDAGTKADPAEVSSLYGMLKRQGGDVSAFEKELTLGPLDEAALQAYMAEGCKTPAEAAERFAFFTRYCFSCLTDADWLDTEAFCARENRSSLTADFAQCLAAVDSQLQGFTCKTELQKKRAALQKQVFDHVDTPGNIFLMNMPTGSGKTLASIKFALMRAIAAGKKRIIYVIPYNSIIDQTADTFEKLFGDYAKILRHQSSFDLETQTPEGSEPLALKKATENWDAAIILTTAVQFFESVYSNKRSKLRKLHNMADSVLIFDEAHLMPHSYLQPCLLAISHITKFLNSEAVLLTATMPDYPKLFEKLAGQSLAIVPLVDQKQDFAAFQKCSIRWMKTVSEEALLSRCAQAPSCLVVVNKRKTAARLYRSLSCKHKFHLSTYMTALDRQRTIAEIRQKLEQLEERYSDLCEVPPDERICVISTSLIEAGVDLDFFTVYRELWGLDSILQSAGRCNREGKRPNADVYAFELEGQTGKAATDAASVTRGLLENFSDPTDEACIEAYYERLLFVRSEELMSHALPPCPRPTQIPFKSYAESFELIDSGTVSVVVAQDEKSRLLLEAARRTGIPPVRKLQMYTFSVYPYELEQLMAQGVIETIGGIFVLTSGDYYRPEVGVCFDGQDYFV